MQRMHCPGLKPSSSPVHAQAVAGSPNNNNRTQAPATRIPSAAAAPLEHLAGPPKPSRRAASSSKTSQRPAAATSSQAPARAATTLLLRMPPQAPHLLSSPRNPLRTPSASCLALGAQASVLALLPPSPSSTSSSSTGPSSLSSTPRSSLGSTAAASSSTAAQQPPHHPLATAPLASSPSSNPNRIPSSSSNPLRPLLAPRIMPHSSSTHSSSSSSTPMRTGASSMGSSMGSLARLGLRTRQAKRALDLRSSLSRHSRAPRTATPSPALTTPLGAWTWGPLRELGSSHSPLGERLSLALEQAVSSLPGLLRPTLLTHCSMCGSRLVAEV